MSYRAKLFDWALINALGGQDETSDNCTDFLSDTIKLALLTDGWAPTTDLQYFSELTDEITESGYTAGGATLSSKTITYDATFGDAQWLKFTAAKVFWVGAFTTPRYCVIYNNTPTNKPLLGYVDFGHVIAGTEPDVFTEVNFDPNIFTAGGPYFSIATTPPTGFLGFSGQVPWRWFPRAWGNIFGGLSSGQSRQTDYLTDSIKCALLLDSWTPAVTDQVWGDIDANEITGYTIYTAGGLELTGKSIGFTDATQRTIMLTSDDILWDNTALIEDAKYAVLYNDSGDQPLLGYLDFMVARTSDGGATDEFRITPGPNGWLTIRSS